MSVTANSINPAKPWLTSDNSKTKAEGNKNTLGKDDFLRLLITELKYQDPTAPMDNREFISQMSTFSSLEQMQNLNTTFTNMASKINDNLLPNLLMQQSSSMIGKEVSYLSSSIDENGEESTVTLTGMIESVVMKDGGICYIIEGKEVAASNITKMSEGSLTTNEQILLEILNILDQLRALLIPDEPLTKQEGGTSE